MPKTETASPQPLVTELNVSANIMAMQPGLYCIFHADNAEIDPGTGLPGVRITPPPGGADPELEIRTFGEGGWLGGAAALVHAPNHASVLVTVYRDANVATQGPQLQVVRLGDAPRAVLPATAKPAAGGSAPLPAAASSAGQRVAPAAAKAAAPLAPAPAPVDPAPAVAAAPAVAPEEAEVAAHIQRRGDVLARLGEWMGVPGSQQWIEGFAVAPRGEIGVKDIEYQAVLGRGWLSPWSDGGQFCGSRGMALPILGLRARLKGRFAQSHSLSVEASFTDGTEIGPSEEDAPVEAPSLAPLEAFRIVVAPKGVAVASPAAARPTRKAKPEPVKTASPRPAPKAPAKAPVKAASTRKATVARAPAGKTTKTATGKTARTSTSRSRS